MKHFDVGVVGYWYATNYGSVVTYHALCHAIEKMGLSTVLIDRPEKERDPEGEDVISRQFLYRHDNISESVSWDEYARINDMCDNFVIGSDQVWTKDAIRIMKYMFFLSFADETKRKIAYAPSFGTNKFDVDDEQYQKVKELLSDFDAISVREDGGKQLLMDKFGIEAKQTMDPVFLMEEEEYHKIADESKIDVKNKYILAYILDPTPDKEAALMRIKEKYGIEVKIVLDARKGTFGRNYEKLSDEMKQYVLRDVNVQDWIRLFENAEYVMTDSHHGLAMAIIFRKQLICYANHGRGYVRFTSLLGLLEMLERMVQNSGEITDSLMEAKIDYERVFQILNVKIDESKEWLKDSLVGERKKVQKVEKDMPKSNTLDKKLLPELSVEAVYSQMLAALLRDYGIKHVVLSSGSRHLQMVRFFEYNDCFTVHKVIDERSAGFYALGLATKLKSPVVLCCTSGTAASNYHTAVAEAYYQHVPLIVITADRLSCLLNQREGQMIPQKDIYKDICLKSISLEVIDSGFRKAVARRMICETILEATHRTPGPVHINIPFSEIYKRYYEDDFPSLYNIAHVKTHRIIRHILVPDRATWKPAVKRLIDSKRILIVYGQNYVLTEEEQSALEKFVQRFNCVICTDNLSNMKCSKSVNAYNICSIFKTSKEAVDELRPEIVITVYGSNVSEISGFVKRHPNVEHWDVAPDGNAADPYRKLRRIFECTPTGFFKRFNVMAEEHNGGNSYYQLWKKYEKTDATVPEKYCQKYAVYKTMKGIPSGSLLHLANSNTVRMACSYSTAPDVTVYCNRGTNGIDGSASTFMGQVALSTELCFLLIGDLSFFYDMNSLWNKKITPNIRIMLFNNSGAGLLKHHGSEVISHVHNTSAEAWVKSLGFKYVSSRTKEEFDENIEAFLSEGDEAVFFEVFTE